MSYYVIVILGRLSKRMQKDPFKQWLMKYHTEPKEEGNEVYYFNAQTRPIKLTVSCHLSGGSIWLEML